jgi:hypothetical protein
LWGEQFKGQYTAIAKSHETDANSGAPDHVTSISIYRKGQVPDVQTVQMRR